MLKKIAPKTIEEHRDYLYSIVRLKLFWMHGFLAEHPEESFQSVLRNRVDIYRKTHANPEYLNPVKLHFDEEPWLSMERAAEKCFLAYKNDRSGYEDAAFEVFKPSIDLRLERDFSDPTRALGYQCGSLRYEPKVRETDGKVHFHIANMIEPHSIFEDPDYLKQCLTLLCWSVENVVGCDSVATHSWLNQNPAWLKYFPEEWHRNLGEPCTDIQWHYGFWGQFINARGTFNKKFGNHLRETGKFPYYPTGSFCRISALREHLKNL